MKPASTAAMIVMVVVSLVHLLRFTMHVPVTVGTRTVPMWVSVVGFLLAGAIAAGMWREQRRTA